MRLLRLHPTPAVVCNRFRLWLSWGVPLVLLLAFIGQQFLEFDSLGLSDGFNHPLTGWDHLLTMLAVGIWAAQLRGHAIWLLPMSFVGVMSLGGFAGAAGLNIPSVEGIILLSCAVFSLLITRRMRFSNKVNVLIVAFFAFFHGFAHGHEISTSASLISYTLGFMLATLLLHGAGILVAKLVILTLAFMFSTMFSATALAKFSSLPQMAVEATDLNHLPQKSQVDWLHNAPSQLDSEAFMPVSDRSEIAMRDMKATADMKSQFSEVSAGIDSWISVQSDVSFAKDFHAFPDSVLAWHTFESYHLSWVFKRHFPQINHSPGKHSLSNSAGQTSPPLSKIHCLLIPQVALSIRNIPIPDFEAHSLQSKDPQLPVGKPHSAFSLNRQPRFVNRNFQDCFGLTASRLRQFFEFQLGQTVGQTYLFGISMQLVGTAACQFITLDCHFKPINNHFS
jgi:urease accessory protein